MEIATIGFTQTSAEHFFGRLSGAGVTRILDIRLNNSSQLAGFAKSADLAYFARAICAAAYEHDVRLAPTPELLTTYREDRDWDGYEAGYRDLMEERDMPNALDRASFDQKTALLCSEATAEHCHRRLVAEMLRDTWGARLEHL